MKRITIFSSLILISIGLYACAQKPQRAPFEVTGHIKSLGNDSVFIYIQATDDTGKEKMVNFPALASNGNFSINGHIDKPVPAYLTNKQGGTIASFILETGKIKIEDNLGTGDLKVTGTPENDLVVDLEAKIHERTLRIRSLFKASFATQDKLEKQRLDTKGELIKDSIMNDRLAFVEAHPSSLNSVGYLYLISSNAPLERLEAAYARLTADVKNTAQIKNAYKTISGRRRTAPGSPAPAFSVQDVNGKTVSLETYKGKYVLLEFWASWCVPCRQQIPDLKAAYEKYKGKGFTILGISIDADKDKWLKALDEEQLPWNNARDNMNGQGRPADNSLATLYGVTPIPDNFLIGPDGKIIDKKIEGINLDEKLSAILK